MYAAFIPNLSLGFEEGVGTSQKHIGDVLQHNRLLSAPGVPGRRNNHLELTQIGH
jgi:hypothetical protein